MRLFTRLLIVKLDPRSASSRSASPRLGTNQSVKPPRLAFRAQMNALVASVPPASHWSAIDLVLADPAPIAPSTTSVANGLLKVPELHPLRSMPEARTSKYLPVLFPAVEGVMKTTPPPGPVSPMSYVGMLACAGEIPSRTAPKPSADIPAIPGPRTFRWIESGRLKVSSLRDACGAGP